MRPAWQSYRLQSIEFLKDLNDGNPEAFEVLFGAYYEVLLLYVLKFIPAIDVAEDIVQSIFISIWEEHVQFEHPKSIQRYLYTAVRNATISLMRQPRYSHLSLNEVSECAVGIESGLLFVEEEVYLLIAEAVEALPQRCREVVKLALDGKSNSEIAELLHVSIETVKTQKKRAKEKLRQCAALRNEVWRD